MDYNIHKVCRVCLEEGALTSIYSTEFAMMPATMLMIVCAKIRVYKTDGLPSVICNNCIYRLGVAYHFKQECENSDVRLRQYLNLERGFGYCDAETNTEPQIFTMSKKVLSDTSDQEGDPPGATLKSKRRSRYQRKPPEEHKKRGPKPLPKLPQTCYECNKTFKCPAQLQMHMRTHSGEKPFACSYCPRKFAQKYNLLIHERTHTKERPFQCEICSKQFAALGNFQAHQKIHSGVRDHLCPICQKAFYTAGDLTKHMVTHTGIKNHHCDICGKAFSRQRDIKTHKRKLHGQRGGEDDDEDETIDADQIVVGGGSVVDAFKCPDCNKEFATAGSLSVHFRTHSSNGGNLLNLPLSSQMPPPPPPPHPHYGHHHHHHPPPPPPPPPPSMHHHHLSLNGPMQTNQMSAAGMPMATHPHMLGHPPPPPTPSGQSALAMMQRLHPY